MHWSDQVGAAALGVRGHPIGTYNDLYYPRKDGDQGNAPVYENSSGQLLFRDERAFPFVWVLSFSLGPENLDDPATWCVFPLLACRPAQAACWLMWTTPVFAPALPKRMVQCRWARAAGPARVKRSGSRSLLWTLQKRKKNSVRLTRSCPSTGYRACL